MKNLKLSSLILALSLTIILVLVGCGGAPEASFTASPTSGDAPLNVSFTNTSSEADEYRWNFGDGSSETTFALTEPVQHEYTKAGTFTANLTAVKGDKPETGSAVFSVNVNPGPVTTVMVSPANIELGIGETFEFTATATDDYGNEISGVNLDWQSDCGTISNGTFTAGTTAGTFSEGVSIVMEKDGSTATGYAEITVKPGPMTALSIEPIEVTAGESVQLSYLAEDENGNPISGLDATWSLAYVYPGSVTGDGLLMAGKRTGTMSGVISVEVIDGDTTLTANGNVTVVAGNLAKVGIGPDPVELGIGMTQQMVAAGADEYGNRISDLSYSWEVDPGSGSISAAGLFTAGLEPDTYKDSITVMVTQGSRTESASIDVTVYPDQILYLSNQHDTDSTDVDWYIMNADGSNQERITFDNVAPSGTCISPDGRRIVYSDLDNMLVVNIDGNWLSALITNEIVGEPAFSPDGTKIAYQSWEIFPAELYVMDVDGGNKVQLTDNDDYDDFPTWSPDGSKMAFISDRDGTYHIYTMNSDGSRQQQLTDSNIHYDLTPRWSPVSDDEIIFFSTRSYLAFSIYMVNPSTKKVTEVYADGDLYCMYPEWSPDGKQLVFYGIRSADIDDSIDAVDRAEIYTVSKTGASLKNITDNGAFNLNPHFLPRMQGVTVTESSIVFPETTVDIVELKSEQLTATVRDAVVRIETDLGSGSGFVIDPDGLILTNNHVISDAEEITVYLSDGSDYNGTVVGRDLIHDIAVIKISATDLHALSFKDVSSIKQGQEVVVLGYPLGKESVSVSSGLVSSVEYDMGRNITWIQTDSAINHGNSGGPMVDMEGNVVGMVSSKLVGVSVEGVGFAISSNTIDTFLPRLIDGETIRSFE